MVDYILSKDPQWYIIVTRSNYEYKAKRDILNGIVGHNFIDNIHDIFVPIKRFTIEYLNSSNKVRHRIISKKILSLYVFINASMTKELLCWLKNLPSVAAVLLSGDALCTLSDEIVNNYKQSCIVTDELYKGNKIVQRDDPFLNEVALLKAPAVQKKEEDSLMNIIYKNAEFVHNRLILEQEQKTKTYKTQLIRKIYNDEKIIKSLFVNNSARVLIDDRINFDQINIGLLKRLLNKYSLMKNFINLDNDTVNNINSYDLNTLKNLVIKYVDKKGKSRKNDKFNKRFKKQ